MATSAVDVLQQHFPGGVITRDDPAYDRTRRVWNGMVDRHPRAIVQPQTSAEVVAAVRVARDHTLPLSVKGGGHGVAGNAICPDGLVIDMSRMNRASVHPSALVASVQGGATLRTLDVAAQAHGLATTAGIYRDTGVAGLALGGGVGLLMRRYGLTCDNLLAAEVVTADGEILEASPDQHPDLFWALRGGGGNFGVVTRMDFRLYPLTHVYGGRMRFAFRDVPSLAQVHPEVLAHAPDDLQAYLNFGTTPTGPALSVVLCHTGPRSEGEALRTRFAQAAQPLADATSYMPYLQMQQHWDDSFPEGHLWYWKSSFLATLSPELVLGCAEAVAQQTLPDCYVAIEPMGGAITRIAPHAMAFADRDAAGTLLIMSTWTDPAEAEARIRWVRETWTALQSFCKSSVYLNYLDAGDETRAMETYGPNLRRLGEIKRAYDPDNVFRAAGALRPERA